MERMVFSLSGLSTGASPAFRAARHRRNSIVGMEDSMPTMMNSDNFAMNVHVWK
jgi:hypothetical protein